ncbi:MAG: hypothetical protein JW894_12020 [Bacteroidales bacterium]|nr:hypothetical protein [Bacteroidales bacterium]
MIIALVSCRKDEFITESGATLKFSTDTVYFDTILSTLGSVTKRFKVYNTHDQSIRIQELYLAGGNSSHYRLNVDGAMGNSFSNIEIRSSDSIYVFVEVTIDPTGHNSPMVIEDSVVFMTNGSLQDVNLIAYGQDVNIFNNEIIESQTWTKEKPYLILNNVAIDSFEVLTIEPGTHIFIHNYASLLVWGQVEAIGTLEEPIVFMGDRFDFPYDQAAGQWGTIYIAPKSTGSVFEYVIIKNSNAGMQVGYPNQDYMPSVEIRNCMILNAASYGIFAFRADIKAYNTIIADCGLVALGLFLGGNYDFYHCSISNIGAYYPSVVAGDYKSRSTPSLYFSNNLDWYELDDDFWVTDVTYSEDLNLNFYNSILYGTKDQEILYDSITDVAFNYYFDHCLIKNHEDSLDYDDPEHFNKIILNIDPAFINDSISLDDYNFELNTMSPAIDSGSINLIQGIPSLDLDFKGNSRTADGMPDLGAFERYD